MLFLLCTHRGISSVLCSGCRRIPYTCVAAGIIQRLGIHPIFPESTIFNFLSAPFPLRLTGVPVRRIAIIQAVSSSPAWSPGSVKYFEPLTAVHQLTEAISISGYFNDNSLIMGWKRLLVCIHDYKFLNFMFAQHLQNILQNGI